MALCERWALVYNDSSEVVRRSVDLEKQGASHEAADFDQGEPVIGLLRVGEPVQGDDNEAPSVHNLAGYAQARALSVGMGVLALCTSVSL